MREAKLLFIRPARTEAADARSLPSRDAGRHGLSPRRHPCDDGRSAVCARGHEREGHRAVTLGVPDVMAWGIFDESVRERAMAEKTIYINPSAMQKSLRADTLAELAQLAGLPGA